MAASKAVRVAALFREIHLTPALVVGAIYVFAGFSVIICNNP